MKKDKINDTKKHRKFKIILLICFAVFSIFFVTVFTYLAYLNTTVTLDTQMLGSINTPISMFSNNGKTFLQDSALGSPVVKIEDLNTYTIDAFTSIEDNKFYSHHGINIKRMIKAMITNITSGEIREGASTISQQLIKNTHLNNKKTYTRKIKEILLASQLEKHYTKNQIMEMYLNAIYFGNGCYGIESASNLYFGKSASMLTINESAILAGLIKSPVYYSPINYPQNCLNRKNLVLKQMLKYNKISEEDYNNNINKNLELNVTYNAIDKTNSTYFICASDEASEILGISTINLALNGYKIYTYFDEEKQNAISNNLSTNEKVLHNAMIVDNETGGINAFSSSFKYGGMDVRRSPASCIKPVLVYAPALENGIIYNCSLIEDTPTTFEDSYSPKNVNDKYYGNISAEKALAYSLNIPAVKIINQTGIENSKKFANKCGITFDETDDGQAIALGGMKYGVTIKELVDSYSPFANQGYYLKSTFVKKIEDKNGNIVYMHQPSSNKVMDEATAYLAGKMMGLTSSSGTCKALGTLGYEIHSKSGTAGTEDNNLNSDLICMAQTGSDTACIWYLSSDYKKENLISTSSYVSPTMSMKNVFSSIYANEKPKAFASTDKVVTLQLDRLSYENGKIELASNSTPDRYKIDALFNKKYVPTKVSTNFTNVEVPELKVIYNNNLPTLYYDCKANQKYELYREENNNTTLLQTTSNAGTTCSYEDANILIGHTYTYYLLVWQEDSDKKKSNEVIVHFIDNNNPNIIVMENSNYSNTDLKQDDSTKKHNKNIFSWLLGY